MWITSVVELGHLRPPVLWIAGSLERGSLPSFSTAFNRAIMEASHPKKVKMPTTDPFDGTIDPDDYLDVYEEQIYIYDVNDVTCYQFFLATLKEITHSGSMVFSMGALPWSLRWRSCSTLTL